MTETAGDRALTCWVVTDGRAGIEAQALGLAEAFAARRQIQIVTKRISVKAPWRVLPPALWGDAFSRLGEGGDALTPPFPDLWIGCGRLSVPLSIAVKKKHPATFTVQLQDPRAPTSLFDLVIAPAHDRLAGENVVSIIGAPTRAIARDPAAGAVRANSSAAVVIGGPNRAMRMSVGDVQDIAKQLRALAVNGTELSVTTSRRTPPEAAQILEDALKGVARIFWRADRDAAEANPYPAMLRGCDAVLVTEDSVNMAIEAAQTGAPVHIIRMARKPFASAKKFDAFHQSLRERGVARYFDGGLKKWNYQPLDETSRAADEILRRLR